jgi:hypothetical protein
MCVDIQRNLSAFSRQTGETGDANGNFVANSSGFKDYTRRIFFENASAKVGDHSSRIVNARWAIGSRQSAIGFNTPRLPGQLLIAYC